MIATGEIACMFPSKGILNKLVVSVTNIPKGGATIVCKIDTIEGEMNTRNPVKNLYTKNLNLGINTGDIVRVHVEPVVEDEEVGEYFISLLWTPEIKEGTIRQFLIDELNNKE